MQPNGFSLIELMIVIIMIGILTSIALPSYQQYTARARFTEVLIAVEPYKTAVALALQEGIPAASLTTGSHGIPDPPMATHNLASLSVDQGVITATGTDAANNATYVLKPNSDGTRWMIEGSCVQSGLCSP